MKFGKKFGLGGKKLRDNNSEEQRAFESTQVVEIDSLRLQLEEKAKAISELGLRNVRLLADMDNLRKRTIREKEEIWQVATIDCVKQLLPFIDSFSRAVESLPKGASDDWAQGILLVKRQLSETLSQIGLETIDASGQFNPMYHEVIMEDGDSEEPENTITSEMQSGYIINGKVIRPSMVKVSLGGKRNE
ncbi:MAG: nucleotide exchange factor GrpE [bacterium]|nr:nucleotide exchange factor GrpE [bacterium]